MSDKYLRPDTLMDVLTWSQIVGLDPREVFGISAVNCPECGDVYRTTCSTSWTEYPGFRTNTMSRVGALRRIGVAERRIANKLGYWPGLKYTECEVHSVNSWHDTIRTKWSKVHTTGTRQYVQVAANIPQTREFENPLEFCAETHITYTIGTEDHPIPNLDKTELCNLVVMPPDMSLTLCGGEYLGHRIRPYEIESFVNGILKIRIPLWVLVKRELQFEFPIHNNKIIDVRMCDQDSFLETLKLYKVNYLEPAGWLVLNEGICDCPDGTCAACARCKIPICFIPVDPENGEFKFQPLINVSGVNEAPCWEAAGTLNDCCVDLHQNYPGHLFDCTCLPTAPLYVEINYLSGCEACYNDCCYPDGVCEDLQNAVAWLAAGLFDFVCDCPNCTSENLSYYMQDLRLLNTGGTQFRTVYSGNSFIFGHTQGAVLAADIVRDFSRSRRLEYAIV